MMKTTIEKINEIKENGYYLSLGVVLEQTFNNFKKIALTSGAIFMVFLLLLIVMGLGLAAIFIGFGSLTQTLTDYQMESLSTAGMVINALVTIILGAFLAPLTAGILQIAHNAETQKEFGFSTAFVHYKSSFLKEIILATILITIVSSSVSLIFQFATTAPGFEDTSKFIWLGSLVNIVFSVLTFITIPLIIFGELKAIDAIKQSIFLVSKKFWIILLLGFIFVIIAMLGIFGFCIGFAFTIPVIYSFQYILYRNIIEIEEKNELDEIGNSEY